jgi:hypothetical protein
VAGRGRPDAQRSRRGGPSAHCGAPGSWRGGRSRGSHRLAPVAPAGATGRPGRCSARGARPTCWRGTAPRGRTGACRPRPTPLTRRTRSSAPPPARRAAGLGRPVQGGLLPVARARTHPLHPGRAGAEQGAGQELVQLAVRAARRQVGERRGQACGQAVRIARRVPARTQDAVHAAGQGLGRLRTRADGRARSGSRQQCLRLHARAPHGGLTDCGAPVGALAYREGARQHQAQRREDATLGQALGPRQALLSSRPARAELPLCDAQVAPHNAPCDAGERHGDRAAFKYKPCFAQREAALH